MMQILKGSPGSGLAIDPSMEATISNPMEPKEIGFFIIDTQPLSGL
jgi:hypothetical protein